ncbi:MAG: SMP-30/gluconolactonase/LRE family protein [Deltaproteobacteria bacterium]|nr:SMP-30/gluconolactonase/LRE family protein [Deltaproteobacteria bacterium]
MKIANAIIALGWLTLAVPHPTRAVCVSAATSGVPAPAVTHLRSYRAALSAPSRLATSAAGTIYVADPGRRQVVVRAASGRVLARIDGIGKPVSVAVGNTGTVYVGDSESGSVTAFDAQWQPLFQLGQGVNEFALPNDISVDAGSGNLFVADSRAQLVKVYSASGSPLFSFGGQGTGDGQFLFPAAVHVDSAAHQVLVADQLTYRIQIFDLGGSFVSCFGGQGSDSGKFNGPQALAVDSAGRVYVADAVEGRIQILDRSGGFIGYIGEFGEASGQLRLPTGLVIDPGNRLLVAVANNACIEMFGLDTYSDAESVVPADVRVEPDAIEKAVPKSAVTAYIEVPGYPLDQIDLASVTANGVRSTSPAAIGDYDGNGIPELRLELDGQALVAALPTRGAATLRVSGTLGALALEGSTTVQVVTCGPGAVCGLGDSDPQCNQAVCVPDVGCTIQPKDDGARCEDGNACTVDESCVAGVCRGSTLACDDRNVCTDDSCDPQLGCQYTNNRASCDDANACTVGDTCSSGACSGVPRPCDDGNVCTDDRCDPAAGCQFTNNSRACDDGKSCTSRDTCVRGVCVGLTNQCGDGKTDRREAQGPRDGGRREGPRTIGAGGACVADGCGSSCLGAAPSVPGAPAKCTGGGMPRKYALLQTRGVLPPSPLRLAAGAATRGDVCAASIRLGRSARIDGDAVALARAGERALTLHGRSRITGDAVTGGGALLGSADATIGRHLDQGGTAPGLAECSATRDQAARQHAELSALPATSGAASPAVSLERNGSLELPAAAAFTGFAVIDTPSLQLGAGSRLTLVGSTTAAAVVVHVRGSMRVGSGARIEVPSLPPENVAFVVDGAVVIEPNASIVGSIFAARRVRLGRGAKVAGAIIGESVELAPHAFVDAHPFAGRGSEQ